MNKLDKRYAFETFLLTVVLFLASIVGLQVFGISVNKFAILLLEAYLIFRRSLVHIGTGKILLLIWYITSVLSCLFGFWSGFENISGYSSNLILYAIQIVFMYIPCLLMSDGLVDRRKSFSEAIIIVAKIHCVWAFVQFVSLFLLGLDFNDLFFNHLLHGVLGSEWSAWNAEAGSLALRIGGLNRDTAFFTLILILGYVSCDSIIWKCLFILASLLSMSRAGIVGMAFLVFIDVLICLKHGFLKKKIIRFGIAVLVLFCLMYVFVPSINYQINYMIFRFISISHNTDVGTNRHLTYLWGSLQTWLFYYSPLQMLFGVGPRAGGVGLQINDIVMTKIGRFSGVWAIESDYCEILLGHGIFGYLIFVIYLFILKKGTSTDKKIVMALLLMSIMYNYSELTLIQIWLICSLDYRSGKKDVIKK